MKLVFSTCCQSLRIEVFCSVKDEFYRSKLKVRPFLKYEGSLLSLSRN